MNNFVKLFNFHFKQQLEVVLWVLNSQVLALSPSLVLSPMSTIFPFRKSAEDNEESITIKGDAHGDLSAVDASSTRRHTIGVYDGLSSGLLWQEVQNCTQRRRANLATTQRKYLASITNNTNKNINNMDDQNNEENNWIGQQSCLFLDYLFNLVTTPQNKQEHSDKMDGINQNNDDNFRSQMSHSIDFYLNSFVSLLEIFKLRQPQSTKNVSNNHTQHELLEHEEIGGILQIKRAIVCTLIFFLFVQLLSWSLFVCYLLNPNLYFFRLVVTDLLCPVGYPILLA
jgi:hypothetical protein